MNTETAERQEETIASVRADLELAHAEAVEARRVATKRNLLEQIVRQARELENIYQAVKTHKKELKAVRNDLTQIDADDLDIEDLNALLHKLKSANRAHDGSVLVSVGLVAAPSTPSQQSRDRYAYAKAC